MSTFGAVAPEIQKHVSRIEYASYNRYFSDLEIEEAGVCRPAQGFRFPHFDLGAHGSGTEYEVHSGLPEDQRGLLPRKERKEGIQEYLCQLNYRQPDFRGINPRYFADKSLLKGFDVRCTFDQAEYFLGNSQAPWGLSEERAILARMDEDFPFEGRSLRCADTSDIVLVHDHEHTTNLFFKLIDAIWPEESSFRLSCSGP